MRFEMKHIVLMVAVMMTAAFTAFGQFSNVNSTVMVNTNTGLLVTPVKITNFWGYSLGQPTGADNGKVYAYNSVLGRFDLQVMGGGGGATNLYGVLTIGNNAGGLSITNLATANGSDISAAVSWQAMTNYITLQGFLTNTISDGSRFQNIWNGPSNTLYIVDPTGVYTNKIGTYSP